MPSHETHDDRPRCAWCLSDPVYITYHDEEWGVPTHDERMLFEMLVLEGAQAGLSWITILKRREAYRQAYANFVPEKVASYTTSRVESLLANPGIVRNRLKIESSVENARRFLAVAEEFGSFDAYLWRFTEGCTVRTRPRPRAVSDIPASSPLSQTLSKDLRRRGFRFIGPVICHSYLQACGLVDDHMQNCFRAREADGE